MNLWEQLDRFMDLLGQAPYLWTAVILALAVGWAVLAHYLVRTVNAGRFAWQQRLRARMGVAPDQSVVELRWLLLILHVLMWPLVASLILRVWGLHDEGRQFANAMFSHGVKVGSVTVVPGKLMIGLLWFVVLFTFTRWLKKKIQYDWLAKTRVEPGTRDAIATLFGYATFAIAAMAGLSVAGLDFTKLAIVAGALTVGIGFGLQNIVNNFVSGLILLFERPVGTGDYVVVGQTEGFVRRIRIRSTQIETVDREIVIVPNSDLLSTHLRRRNLRDRYGNLTVSVKVAYGTDPELVKRTLLAVAEAHPKVVKAGKVRGVGGPGVVFTGFGVGSLDFDLNAQVAESNTRGAVASDLRFAIEAAFRQAGIELALPQQEVRVRDPASPPVAVSGDGAAGT